LNVLPGQISESANTPDALATRIVAVRPSRFSTRPEGSTVAGKSLCTVPSAPFGQPLARTKVNAVSTNSLPGHLSLGPLAQDRLRDNLASGPLERLARKKCVGNRDTDRGSDAQQRDEHAHQHAHRLDGRPHRADSSSLRGSSSGTPRPGEVRSRCTSRRGRRTSARRTGFSARQEGRDKPNGTDVGRAQYDAIVDCGIPDRSKLERLAGIRQPTLVANGDNDTMIPTANTHILARHIPNARVRIYADAGHGFLFQFPTEFAEIVARFLA